MGGEESNELLIFLLRPFKKNLRKIASSIHSLSEAGGQEGLRQQLDQRNRQTDDAGGHDPQVAVEPGKLAALGGKFRFHSREAFFDVLGSLVNTTQGVFPGGVFSGSHASYYTQDIGMRQEMSAYGFAKPTCGL